MIRGTYFRKSTGTPDRKQAELKEREFRKKFVDDKGVKKTFSLRNALKDLLELREGTPNYKNLSHFIPILEGFFLPSTPLHEIDTSAITRFVELHPDNQLDGWKLSDEARRFRQDQDAADLWILFCHTGARFAEISKLEWRQIDLDGRTILLYRHKVDNETRLVMTDDAYEVFRRRATNPLSTRYVFPNRKLNGPRTDQSHSISKAIKRAGLKAVLTARCTPQRRYAPPRGWYERPGGPIHLGPRRPSDDDALPAHLHSAIGKASC